MRTIHLLGGFVMIAAALPALAADKLTLADAEELARREAPASQESL